MSVATIVARRARRVFRLWGAAGPSRQLTTRRARRGATCRPPPAYAGPAQACGLGPVSSVDPPFCSPNARARRPVRARWPHPSFAFALLPVLFTRGMARGRAMPRVNSTGARR